MDIAISTLQQIRTYIGMGPLMEIHCMQTIPNNHTYVLTLKVSLLLYTRGPFTNMDQLYSQHG